MRKIANALFISLVIGLLVGCKPLSLATPTARARARIMHDAMDIFRRNLDAATRLLTLEHGKPLNDSIKECSYSADVIDFYAEEGRRIEGTHFAGDLGPTHSFVLKQPIGGGYPIAALRCND